jgi:hypothetical protein
MWGSIWPPTRVRSGPQRLPLLSDLVGNERGAIDLFGNELPSVRRRDYLQEVMD